MTEKQIRNVIEEAEAARSLAQYFRTEGSARTRECGRRLEAQARRVLRLARQRLREVTA